MAVQSTTCEESYAAYYNTMVRSWFVHMATRGLYMSRIPGGSQSPGLSQKKRLRAKS